MPDYEYHCEHCGPFTEWRSLDQCTGPANCPSCDAPSPKQFSAVHLRSMRPENRTAWERNERSAHAPHVCGAGCAHGNTTSKRRASPAGETPLLQASSKANSRPWMLGH